MYNQLSIEPMNESHIYELVKLWELQFTHFCQSTPMYPFWHGKTQAISEYLNSCTKNGRGIVTKYKDKIVGYFAYDAFCFHGAESGLIHFVGNAATLENRYYIYLALYKAISGEWVRNGYKNHYFTFSAADDEAKKALFDAGFGSYLVDAFRTPQIIPIVPDDQITVRKAVRADADELYRVVKESRAYYSSPPIFLKMDDYSFEELIQLIENSRLFIAKHLEDVVGFMNLTIAEHDDIFRMCAKGFGQINDIGAYIQQTYRNRNIGNRFINAVSDFCLQNRIDCIHVDFESANMYANKFWRKHFAPVMLSLKRTIHADI